MATLLPEQLVPGENVQKAEKRLLGILGRDNAETIDWVVMHSVDIALHLTRRMGEADFLILMPDLGFLVIEVKDCPVSREGGTWIYHREEPKAGISPFEQARDARFSLKRWLEDKSCDVDGILWNHCVIFTAIDFDVQSSEWADHQILNKSQLEADGLVPCIQHIMWACRRQHPKDRLPGRRLVKDVARTIRGDFKFDADPESAWNRTVRQLETAMLNATEDQARAIRAAALNPRVLVTGPAGTGKTFAALKLAQMWAEKGQRVGLFCFNALLGRELARQSSAPRVFSGTLDKFRLQLLGEGVPDPIPDRFWADMRDRALEAASDLSEDDLFDVVLIDEAQDLTNEADLDLLDFVLKGGLEEGRCFFFGDFERQAIYASGQTKEELIQRIKKVAPHIFEYPLDTNCRNSRSVAENIKILAGLDPGYSQVRNQDVQGIVQPHFCANGFEKTNKLINLAHELSRKYSPGDVVILSPVVRSLAAEVRSTRGPDFAAELRSAPIGGSSVRYGTIQSFKGLEAAAVILTDCAWGDQRSAELFYNGLSRARIEAHMILDEAQRAEYRRLVLQ